MIVAQQEASALPSEKSLDIISDPLIVTLILLGTECIIISNFVTILAILLGGLLNKHQVS